MKHLITLFTLLTLASGIIAQDDLFTIYLVRHAEKRISIDDPKDPHLNKCGEQRAESIAHFMKNIKLDAIYSTDYFRTKSTAKPTSTQKGLVLKMYNPQKLKEFAAFLIDQKEDVLVVGHSNTTGVLAGLLVGENIESFDESIYDRIYQVIIYKNKVHLNLFHTSFKCKE